MKKGTVIAFVISLIYCSFATYVVLFEVGFDSKIVEPVFPLWFENSLTIGGILGVILGMSFGYIGLWIGQIITFFLLFYILKTILNSLFKKSK